MSEKIKHYKNAAETHNARFAESCRDDYLSLTKLEKIIAYNNLESAPPLKCEKEIYLGFFFDGTNNNKYRDVKSDSQSNVARLFEVFIGTPTLVDNSGKTLAAPYGGDKDVSFNPQKLSPDEFKFYRKVYIPGLGTAFPEIGDYASEVKDGLGLSEKSKGLAMALYGQARVLWALVQVINQIHAVFHNQPLYTPAQTADWLQKMQRDLKVVKTFKPGVLQDMCAELAQKIKGDFTNRVRVTKIRVSVFGFSRGSAEARTFVNWFLAGIGTQLCNVPIQIDLLGIFDTVASVGVAHISHLADGHFAWADGEYMTIPPAPEVKRCVHLVAAHEVRMCFPLDSVSMNQQLPTNCKEIVYPGVHSDVGGGYPTNDQGRCPESENRISQITLAQMYREALMAAVPLAATSAMPEKILKTFAVGDKIKKAFNDYVAKTRVDSVAPTKGKGALGVLFPEETQPPEPLITIMHRHYAHYLSWRKFCLEEEHRGGRGAHQRGGLASAADPNGTKQQDIYDIKRTNEDLKKELVYGAQVWSSVPGVAAATLGAGLVANLVLGPVAGAAAVSSVVANAHDLKTTALKEILPLWGKMGLDANKDKALIDFFDWYVHDSRAWFKFGGMADDEWFGGGKTADGKVRPSIKAKTEKDEIAKEESFQKKQAEIPDILRETQARWRQQGLENHPDYRARQIELEKRDKQAKQQIEASKARVHVLKTRGALNGGENPAYEEWTLAGYLRWRAIYTTKSSRKASKKQLSQFEMRVLQDQIRQARLKDAKQELAMLEKMQSEQIKTYLAAVKQNREVLIKSGGNVRAYDEGSSNVLKMLLAPAGQQNEKLRQQIMQLQAELAAN